MVIKFENTNNVTADVIILGCSLPGIVTAHKLKKKFGNTIDIVVLDLAGKRPNTSKYNVAFQENDEESDVGIGETSAKYIIDNIARHFLTLIAKDFNVPLPDAIIDPIKVRCPLNKLFEYQNGTTVDCETNFHNFDYLNVLERFELNQYQSRLDQNIKNLFLTGSAENAPETKLLLYYDQTPMEKDICSALLFPTSREIMRNTVRLVCGASAKTVSVLFYLHQCYRASSSKNHLDGSNTRIREKLLAYCRKRLTSKLESSIASITLVSKAIEKISSSPEEQVILKTLTGDTNYVCNLLAMAMKPDELHDIEVESHLLAHTEMAIIHNMIGGKTKKFVAQYEENFWRREGYSGDILSIRGPVIWATERPMMSSEGSKEKYAALVGYLRNNNQNDSKEFVLNHLIKLFGTEAANPISYKESEISDIYIPRCGDYISLKKLTLKPNPKYIEWGALDIFAEGDVAAALEAGHTAYVHVVSSLRPQAQTYEDISAVETPTVLMDNPFEQFLPQVTITSSLRLMLYSVLTYAGVKLLKSYMGK